MRLCLEPRLLQQLLGLSPVLDPHHGVEEHGDALRVPLLVVQYLAFSESGSALVEVIAEHVDGIIILAPLLGEFLFPRKHVHNILVRKPIIRIGKHPGIHLAYERQRVEGPGGVAVPPPHRADGNVERHNAIECIDGIVTALGVAGHPMHRENGVGVLLVDVVGDSGQLVSI